MSQNIRSFIAFDLNNEEVLKRLTEAQRLLIETGAELKPVEPRNIHVTLRFLGNITPDMVDSLYEEMKKVQFSVFDIDIRGVGAFPNARYARVVWAGITKGSDQLRSIFLQLEPKLQSLGFQSDPRGFSPHLTIARVRSGRKKAELAGFIEQNGNFEFGTLKADCLKLKQSRLTPTGPIYSTLKEYCPK